MRTIVDILGMIKISHSVLAMPFALIATFLAANGGIGGTPAIGKIALIVICMVTARAVAMTFNRIVDRHIDARNIRTHKREIPAGLISVASAWYFMMICIVIFIGTCTLFYYPIGLFFGYGNIWPLILSIPFLVFICGYSLTKRFTYLCHLWLGASLMLAPVGAWIAISPPTGPILKLPIIVLGISVMLWTCGFDIIYACQDIEVDRKEGLNSIPARFGAKGALWISRFCHSMAVSGLFWFALLQPHLLGSIYFVAVLLVIVLLIFEHVLVWGGKMKRIQMAFATINGIVSVLLATATICDIYIS